MDFLNWLVKRLIDPTAVIWLLLLLMSVVHLRQKRRIEASGFLTVALLMSIFGGTSAATVFMAQLEEPYYREDPLDVVPGDVVLILGGHLEEGKGEPHGFDSGAAIDRVLAGVELVRHGKGKMLLLGGGAADGSKFSKTEHSFLKPWMERWQLLDVPLESIGLCRNTREEAMAVKHFVEVRGLDKVILVTSARHMRRALGVFRSAGVNVEPAACDFQCEGLFVHGGFDYSLIPKSGRFVRVYEYLREVIGWHVYRSRGWIKD